MMESPMGMEAEPQAGRTEGRLCHMPSTTFIRTRGTEMPISETMHTGSRLAFVGCEISTGPSAGGGAGQAQAQGRREVVVSGRRVKTVDVHAHCIVPEAAQLINHPLEAPALLWSNAGDRLAQMDRTGVDVEALSINPYWYRAERDAVTEVIRVQNEALVAFCASH